MRVLSALFFLYSCCNAKVINADAKAPYTTRVFVGIQQLGQWISEWMGEPEPRPERKVELAVVGMGRTGSTSFTQALIDLGYSPIHDDQAHEVADVYNAWWEGDMDDEKFLETLGKRGFDAPMIPVHRYVELVASKPNIKVVITVRDKKKWAQSYLAIVDSMFVMGQPPFSWMKIFQDLLAITVEMGVNVPTGGKPELIYDVPTLEAGYDAWVEFVRKTIPKERLLEFSVKEGWGPLCEFLDKPVPETPFPHINDRVVVTTIIFIMKLLTWIWPLLFASPLLILSCCSYYCCFRKKINSAKKQD